MKKYRVHFKVYADGSNLLWNIDDVAEVEAENKSEAERQVRYHCRAWGYNSPDIIGIEDVNS